MPKGPSAWRGPGVPVPDDVSFEEMGEASQDRVTRVRSGQRHLSQPVGEGCQAGRFHSIPDAEDVDAKEKSEAANGTENR
jgi:hypothetical protein